MRCQIILLLSIKFIRHVILLNRIISKRKPTNGTHVGDGDLNFDPRKTFARRKIKRFNIEWDNKYNASKLTYLAVYKINSMRCICMNKKQSFDVMKMFSDLKLGK